jgi:putative AdoMet-dependent methyltransferase
MTDLFEEKAKDWDANERINKLAAAITASILEQVPLHGQMTVLDFGGGTGLISAGIAPRVNRIVAVDTSQAMLDKLAEKTDLKDKVEVVCRDILENPLDLRFDLIVSAMTMHHVEDTSRLIPSFSEHLNESGMVALADLDKEDGSFHPAGTEGVFHSGFDRDDIRNLLENHGFKEIEFFTAHSMAREGKDYPVFLVTASKA